MRRRRWCAALAAGRPARRGRHADRRAAAAARSRTCGRSTTSAWCARSPAAPLPVVCGVGHETDVTLADLAADLRAPTPTAAAELVAPLRDELLQALDGTRATHRARAAPAARSRSAATRLVVSALDPEGGHVAAAASAARAPGAARAFCMGPAAFGGHAVARAHRCALAARMRRRCAAARRRGSTCWRIAWRSSTRSACCRAAMR